MTNTIVSQTHFEVAELAIDVQVQEPLGVVAIVGLDMGLEENR